MQHFFIQHKLCRKGSRMRFSSALQCLYLNTVHEENLSVSSLITGHFSTALAIQLYTAAIMSNHKQNLGTEAAILFSTFYS